MKDIEFNLIDEPWIKAAKQDSTVEELSIKDVLIGAHEYKSLAGEMAAQDIAILRFLCALVHTVISKTDINGNNAPVEDEDESIERWKSVWDLGHFPEKAMRDYLEKWKDRFWLFHPDRPFYQVPKAKDGTENTVAKLNGAVSESNNKARLFSSVSGKGKEEMSYSEGARWLLFLNGFDDCAAKQKDKSDGSRGSTVAWLGKLGLIYSIGNNLFETIMLNMPMITGEDGDLWENDVPTWEPDEARSRERDTIAMPDNLAALYTLQSRRILLKREGDSVVGYSLLGGDAFDEINALNEPMTLWRFEEDKDTKRISYRPKLHDRDRYIWRDFASLTAYELNGRRPGIVGWCDYLRKKRIVPKKRILVFGVVCVRYDSSQSSSITDCFFDNVLFHQNLLSDSGKDWREEIENQINKIENEAKHIGVLVSNLIKAEGLDSKKYKSKVETAKEEFFSEIDLIFREWLMKLDADHDIEERNKLAIELESSVRDCALRVGRELVDQTSESGFIGRTIEKKHYSSPEAYRWFKYNTLELYPKLEGDEADE